MATKWNFDLDKVDVYNICVFVYNVVYIWVLGHLPETYMKRQEWYDHQYLCHILGIQWQIHMSDTDILKRKSVY